MDCGVLHTRHDRGRPDVLLAQEQSRRAPCRHLFSELCRRDTDGNLSLDGGKLRRPDETCGCGGNNSWELLDRQHHWATDLPGERRTRVPTSQDNGHGYPSCCCVGCVSALPILCVGKSEKRSEGGNAPF